MNRAKVYLVCVSLVIAVVASGAAGFSSRPDWKDGYRLVYINRNFSAEAHVAEVVAVVERAAAVGFNGVVLDASLDRIDLREATYFGRLARVVQRCRELGLAVVPHVGVMGYGRPLLEHDRNLAGAVPVRDAPFVVEDGEARLVSEKRPLIPNGGFETFRGHRAEGVAFCDRPGEVTFVDRDVRRSGTAALRIENLPRNAGKGRVFFDVRVQPFRCYRLSFHVRSEELDAPGGVRVDIAGADGRVLMVWNSGDRPPRQWHELVTGFNSLDSDSVRIHIGVWSGRAGRLWIDDVELREVGLLNVLRRGGTPLIVRAEGTGRVYKEGEDFEPIRDEHLDFTFDHDPARLMIRPTGSIRDGERLRIDFYQSFQLKNLQVGVCPSEPAVLDHYDRVLARVEAEVGPDAYFIGVDEWRHGGWCRTCEETGLEMGALVGRTIAALAERVRDVNPGADIMVWSDMLDPHANATAGPYFLARGSLARSWSHVPDDLIIVCWNETHRRASLDHFVARGHRVVAAAYYDDPTLESSRQWIRAISDTPGAVGIMYATWQDDYSRLEAFSRLFGGGD